MKKTFLNKGVLRESRHDYLPGYENFDDYLKEMIGGSLEATPTSFENLEVDILNGSLVPNQWYEFTHTTLYYMPNTMALNNSTVSVSSETFRARAISQTQLAPQVISIEHPKDIIFYDIDKTRWGVLEAPESQGFIYRRVDTEKRVDVCCDFRAARFRRWAVDFTAYKGYSVDYSLMNTSISRAMHPTNGWGSTITFNAISSEDYVDLPMFGNYTSTHDVHFGACETGMVIPNITTRNEVIDCYIDNIGYISCGILNGLKASKVPYLLQTKTTNGATTNDWFEMDSKKPTGEVGGTFIGAGAFWGDVNRIESNVIMYPSDSSTTYFLVTSINSLIMAQTHITYSNIGWWCELRIGSILGATLLNVAGNQWGNATVIPSLDTLGKQGEYPVQYSVIDFTGGAAKTVHIDALTSNLEYNINASSNISLNYYAATDELPYAYIYNAQGTGTVSVSTFSIYTGLSSIPIGKKILWKPQNGLILEFPFNNVTNGFLNKNTITADGSLGEVLWIERVDDTHWRAYN